MMIILLNKLAWYKKCLLFYSQIFPANNDRNSVVAHVFRPRIHARYVKVKPNSWFRHISMRFELYGQRTGETS